LAILVKTFPFSFVNSTAVSGENIEQQTVEKIFSFSIVLSVLLINA
jgi:hypothetical protein